MRKNGLEAQGRDITNRFFRRIKGELTDQKREINHRHFKRIKGELTDLAMLFNVLLSLICPVKGKTQIS